MASRSIMVALFVAASVLVVGSCKDMGSTQSPPPLLPLVLGQSPLVISLGYSSLTTIAGGTPPYVLVSNGDPTIVSSTVAGSTLRIRGLAVGTATVVVGDQSAPQLTASVNVSVVLFSVGLNSFNLLAGDTASTTLTGGTPPYSFVSKGDTTKVLPVIVGSRLVLRALAAGTSSIILGDNSTPRLSLTVSVNVTTPLSFANQVQPIFTANCSCHRPGGSGPFSLQAGDSYATLVNVQATGACTALKRVLPGNAAASVLYKKVSGTDCGTQMPQGRTALQAADIQKIQEWINQGARNN